MEYALKRATFLLVLLQTACANNPVQPDLTSGVQIVTVTKPVVMRCVRYEDIPAPPAFPAGCTDVRQLAACASADDRALQAYADQLRAIAIACATTEVHQ